MQDARIGLVAPAVPAVPAGLRAAIVTLWDGEAAFACAVMHWCDHAERLAHVFRQYLGARTDIAAVLTTSRGDDVLKSDCPKLQIIRPDGALVAAVKRFSTIGCKGRWAGGLQALSHSHSHRPTHSLARLLTRLLLRSAEHVQVARVRPGPVSADHLRRSRRGAASTRAVTTRRWRAVAQHIPCRSPSEPNSAGSVGQRHGVSLQWRPVDASVAFDGAV